MASRNLHEDFKLVAKNSSKLIGIGHEGYQHNSLQTDTKNGALNLAKGTKPQPETLSQFKYFVLNLQEIQCQT